MMIDNCPHCIAAGEDRLWEGEKYRVVLVHQPGFPGWCRVIWNAHVGELTDLSADDRRDFLNATMLVEELLRRELKPRKINLAALGTAMPHLHFHIIPRFEDDPTFPDPVWLAPVRESQRQSPPYLVAALKSGLGALDAR